MTWNFRIIGYWRKSFLNSSHDTSSLLKGSSASLTQHSVVPSFLPLFYLNVENEGVSLAHPGSSAMILVNIKFIDWKTQFAGFQVVDVNLYKWNYMVLYITFWKILEIWKLQGERGFFLEHLLIHETWYW